MNPWFNLTTKERYNLYKAYKEQDPSMSYWDAANDFNAWYGIGGEELQSESAMNGMMKSKMAIANEFGSKSAKRMISPNPKTGQTPDGVGTHFMQSMGNYAVPLLQDLGGNELTFVGYNPKPNTAEEIYFDRPEDAIYFSENYKNVAPMMKSFNGK